MNVTSTPRLPSAMRGGLVLRRAMALALATGLVASAAAACSSDNATTTAGPAATSPPVAATSESGASTTERRSGTTAGTTRGTATPGTSRRVAFLASVPRHAVAERKLDLAAGLRLL